MNASEAVAEVAIHAAVIEAVQNRQDRFDISVRDLRAEIAGLRSWIMGAVLASCLGLVGVIAQLIRR
jgi:hypothetical protein